MWVVHNIHSPAVKLLEGDHYSLDGGRTLVKCPTPLCSFDSRDEAEEWRNGKLVALHEKDQRHVAHHSV